MKYTNKLNLPEVFNKIAEKREEKQIVDNRYSVTELLDSTQEIKLKRKYWNNIEIDISDTITALFGSAVHKVFEENSNPEESEVKLEVQFGENTVVGVIDHVKDDLIEDYKTTSVSKVMKKDFKEHENQILIYALLRFKKFGVITRRGKLYYLMKDYSKVKAQSSSNYTQSPIYIHEFEIKDSDYDYIEKMINNKLKELNSEFIPNCTDEERWYTGTEYAVYKNVTDKRASLVTDNEQEAHDFITNKCNGSGEIKVRKGKYLKCELYCNCNKFCDQWRKEENDVI